MELSVMDRINMILNDPEKVPMTLAQIVSEEIREFKRSPQYSIMLEAEAYYRNRSSVQTKTVDVANRSNAKIERPILKKLVDQKANYLLSKPWTVDTENEAYGEALNKVFDQTFRRKIKSLGKGAVKSGIAWIQPYFDDDGKLAFMRIPSPELIPLWRDSERTKLDAFIRFYDQVIYIGIRKHVITHAEFWWTGGVKYFILCNPHNPVGRVWTHEELKAVGDICVKHGVRIISDEIHSDLMLDGHKHIPMASVSSEIAAITTTCIAPSKTFNLAGLQSSTIVYDTVEHKDAYVAELKRMDIARNNCFSLVATMAAYEQGEEWLDQLLVYLSGNMRFIREFCAEHLPELKPNTPEATYLCWIDASALGMDDAALKKFCVEKAGVAFGEGNEFGLGGSGFLRLNAACPRSVIQKALTQLEAAVYNY